ncbi:MAG TPA: hypothetical protein PLQ49_02405 [Methanothrix sp.]|nr:hypothetical protein [Methanothrix sp.]HRW83438.1 hypothetical protein [Methanothrix sp.]
MEMIQNAFDLIKKRHRILPDRMVHDEIEAGRGRARAPPRTPFIILPSLWGDLHHLDAGRKRR